MQKNCQQLTEQDKVAVAETLFILAVAKCNIRFSLSNTASELFPKMFPDSKLASEFSVSRTKLSYIISDGIGPLLKEKLIEEVIKYGSFYSIQVNETRVHKKRVQQFDNLVRFYNKVHKKVLNY